jgi:hypothetical protein
MTQCLVRSSERLVATVSGVWLDDTVSGPTAKSGLQPYACSTMCPHFEPW